MENESVPPVERIQAIIARMLATQPAGRGLCLIGGFRYRLLNRSARFSQDLEYHWEGELAEKQREIVAVFRAKLLPEIKRLCGYESDVRPATGPDAESPVVRTVELACYCAAQPGSRIDIPVDLMDVARLDPPIIRTVEGTVFLTLSDADMIESKIVACLARSFLQVRDVLDIFLFQDALLPDSPARLSQKLSKLAMRPREAGERLRKLSRNRTVHVRGIERLLDEQVEPAVAPCLPLAAAI